MKRLVLCLVVAVLLLGAGEGRAAITLPDLPIGSQYQLAFVTAGRRDGTSPNISVYNNFVTTEAALNPELPDATWHAVASTVWGVRANVNAPSGGLPVYNTQGILVASADTGLYRYSLLSPIGYNQFGVAYEGSIAPVWTGSTWQGEWAGASASLGVSGSGASARIGSGKKALNKRWMEEAFNDITAACPLYALSEPITVLAPIPDPVPEPTTLVIWSLLGTLGLIYGWRRRRRGA